MDDRTLLCIRKSSFYLSREAFEKLGIGPGRDAQQWDSGRNDQSHFPASTEGNDISANDGDQVLNDQAQLVPNCPSDGEGVSGQPPCYGPT